MQSSSTLTRVEQEKLLTPHEYIRDTLSFRYQDCISCGNRTEFTCIKCGYCYTCHWKKEQVEEIELRNNLKDFYASLSNASNDSTDNSNQELKSQQAPKDKEQEWETIDVFGQQAEPICTIPFILVYHLYISVYLMQNRSKSWSTWGQWGEK